VTEPFAIPLNNPAFLAYAVTSLVLCANLLFLWAYSGGAAGTAAVLFGIFTGARVLHSAAYLAGKQPWRTIFFVTGGLATIALMLAVVWLMIRGPS